MIPAPKRPFVVIIGSTPTTRKIIEVSLHRQKCEVVSYEKPLDALFALRRGDIPVPDVAFVDLDLSGTVNCYAVIRILRAFRQLAIIGVAQRANWLSRWKARCAGANAYLVKPFTEQQLFRLVLEFSRH